MEPSTEHQLFFTGIGLYERANHMLYIPIFLCRAWVWLPDIPFSQSALRWFRWFVSIFRHFSFYLHKMRHLTLCFFSLHRWRGNSRWAY